MNAELIDDIIGLMYFLAIVLLFWVLTRNDKGDL